jgi:hypothetical protein
MKLNWRNQLGYPAHTGLISPSIHLSVCLFIRPLSMKTRRIFTSELKSGCSRGVFCLLSIPSKYLFLCMRRKFGFNKKICRNLLIPPAGYISKYTAHNDYTEDMVRRILIAAAILDLEELIRLLPSPHRINFSFCLFVRLSVPYLAAKVADMSASCCNNTRFCSNFGQMGRCPRHKIEDVGTFFVGLSRHPYFPPKTRPAQVQM